MKLLAHLLLMATAISGAIADDYGRCDGPPDQEQKAVCGDVAGKLVSYIQLLVDEVAIY